MTIIAQTKRGKHTWYAGKLKDGRYCYGCTDADILDPDKLEEERRDLHDAHEN